MSSKPFAPGTRLGAYRILERIGQGGMGAVYKAEDSRGEVVALKVLLPDLARNETFLARFRREAKAAQAVSHENVVAIRDVGEDSGVLFLALELVPGGTLKQAIRKKGALPWKEAASIGAGIARGLSAIHFAGLVHRDLKPENVLLDERGEPRIADLGLVGRGEGASALSRGSLTKTGEILGTLEYMAPEQCDDAGRVDARADLYSLGATLHAMLTGDPPFRGTSYEVLTKHLTQAPSSARETVPEIPERLDALVLSLLAKKPGARPKSANAVASELEEIAASSGAGRGSGSRVALVLGALVLALVAGGIGLAVLSSGETREEPPAKPTATASPSNTARPAPTATKAPEPAFPDLTSSFAKSARGGWSLSRIFGGYGGKVLAPVASVAFSPDGKTVISGSHDPALVLWDLEKGLELRRFPVHAGKKVLDVAFSQKGDLAISCQDDGAITVFDAATGRLAREKISGRQPHALAVVPPEGTRLATANGDGTISFYDLSTLGELDSFDAHEGAVTSISFDRRGVRMLSGGADRRIRLWNTETRQAVTTSAEEDPVASVALSPDGTHALVATCQADRRVVALWDAASGTRIKAYRGGHYHQDERGPREVAISPDGTRGVVAEPGGFHVLDMNDGTVVGRLRATTHWSTDGLSVAYSRDGTRVATGECKNQVRLWDPAQEREISPGDARGAPSEARTLALTKDGKRAIVPAGDGVIRIWDLASGTVSESIDTGRQVNALAVSPDERRAVTTQFRRNVECWDLGSRASAWMRGDSRNVLAVAISPDGSRALVGADHRTVTILDMTSGDEVGKLDAREGVWVEDVAYTPDGSRALVAGVAGADRSQGSLELFSLQGDSGTLEKRLEGHGARVRCALFVDSKRALSASEDKTMRLWNLETGELVRAFPHDSKLHRAAAMPGGQRAVSTSEDGTIRFWDLSSGAELDRIDLATSHDVPWGVAASADGRSIFVSTFRGVLLRFDAR